VELDSLHGKIAVAQPHNQAILRPGADFKRVRQSLAHYRQGMIAYGGKGVGQSFKDSPAIMVDKRRLAVLDFAGAVNFASVAVADALVAEADPQNRQTGAEMP